MTKEDFNNREDLLKDIIEVAYRKGLSDSKGDDLYNKGYSQGLKHASYVCMFLVASFSVVSIYLLRT